MAVDLSFKNRILMHAFGQWEEQKSVGGWTFFFFTADPSDFFNGIGPLVEPVYDGGTYKAAAGFWVPSPEPGTVTNNLTIKFWPASEDWEPITYLAIRAYSDYLIAGPMWSCFIWGAFAEPISIEKGQRAKASVGNLIIRLV